MLIIEKRGRVSLVLPDFSLSGDVDDDLKDIIDKATRAHLLVETADGQWSPLRPEEWPLPAGKYATRLVGWVVAQVTGSVTSAQVSRTGAALPRGGGTSGYYEEKMIGGYGPYLYLRWREGGHLRSKYLGKVAKPGDK